MNQKIYGVYDTWQLKGKEYCYIYGEWFVYKFW